MIEYLLFLVVGVALGFGLGFAYRSRKVSDESASEDPRRWQDAMAEKEAAVAESARLEGRLENSVKFFKEQQEKLAGLEAELKELVTSESRLKQENKNLTDRLSEQRLEFEKMNERFKNEFRTLAADILKKNTVEFSEANQKQVGALLEPLKQNIEKFEKQVRDVYTKENESRSKLFGQVEELMKLNSQISEDANNLTKALKGDSQKQGAWGEFILESILEHSGLEKGIEYETQVSNRTDDGIFRPDVIVKLPDNKCIIIDSKVSLKAYESYVNADSQEDRDRFLAQHIASLRQHVKGLSSKNYQEKTNGISLDFVLMFVPIEAGFSEALKSDRDLYNFAWDNRIVIVSPTTLLATLKTVASVWTHEKQNKNVLEIAKESGNLYDKFKLFLDDLERIRKGVETTSKAYDDAMNKLHTGKGNLIRRAEKIKALGAKASKEIPHEMVQKSLSEE